MNNTFSLRSVQIPPDEVQVVYSTIVNGTYFGVALLTALIYHSTLIIEEEVKYFWPKPFNSISLIFFTNRYVGILAAVSTIAVDGLSESFASCKFLFLSIEISNLITVLVTDYILVIRVLALYQNDKKMTVTLNCLLGLEAAIALAILIYSITWEKQAVFVEPQLLSVCGALRVPSETFGIITWGVPLAFGSLLLILCLYKAAEYWRLSSGFKGLRLIRVLMRDQVLYYSLVIFCFVCKIVANATFLSNNFLSELVDVVGSPTLLCILAGQLLINLKEAGELGVNGGTNYRTRSVSEIDFAEGPAPVEAPVTQSTEVCQLQPGGFALEAHATSDS